MSIELTEDQMNDIFMDHEIEGFEYEGIEQTEWTDEGKFQSCDVIFKHNDKFYMFCMIRSGNHWSGYEFEYIEDEAVEVVQQEVIIKKWVVVKVEADPNLDETEGQVDDDDVE